MNNPPFTFRKGNVFYFGRQVPKDLRHLYHNRKVAFSLRTSDRAKARKIARRIASDLDQAWASARYENLSVETRLVPRGNASVRAPKLSQIFSRYVEEKTPSRAPQFAARANSYWTHIGPALGDRLATSLERRDAIWLRDRLTRTGLSGSTVAHTIGFCRTLINFATDELELNTDNPFVRVPIDTSDSKRRPSYDPDMIRELQVKLLHDGSDAALALVLLSETGMRLSECVYMSQEELVLSHKIPHIALRWTKVRRLKNGGSEREIPLSGFALEAALRSRPRHTPMGQVMVFPDLMNRKRVFSANVGALLRRRLTQLGYGDLIIHSFRHTFRSRMRELGAPSYIADQLGGWSPRTVGERYGAGVGLESLASWMARLSSPATGS